MRTIAILATQNAAYSETFIQAHRQLPFNIKYYYGGVIPTYLDNGGLLSTRFERIKYRLSTLVEQRMSFEENALMSSLKNEKVECVLAEYGIVGAECLNVVKALKLPLVVHFHGMDASEYSVLKRYKNKYVELFVYASSVIAVSNRMVNDLISLGCSADKIVLNTYGPNPAFFEIENKFQKKQFIAIGRFVDKKAPYLTLLAFSKVLEKHPDAKLLMCGEGPLLNACKNLATVWSMNASVNFLGITKPAQIKQYFSESLAFVQHSIVAENGDSEGTPVAVLEAAAAGLPVIATHHAGIPDVIKHGETGFLVKELDVKSMANFMIALCDDFQLAATLGSRSSQNIKVNFSLEKHMQTLAKMIGKAIAAD